MPKTRRPSDLPEKICATCGRPFRWRKKWARDWEAVRHCSDACRTGRYLRAQNGDGATTPKTGKKN
ncbi:DUF2256 domain-containing protein [Rhodobacter veldkampii DSM 11550]|uniref:DUF2256 domain-containing protein n=1 Tax=Phaeovulum veldkampii DSM 11550 TaxID=1185920 RepID=A0A2T4JLZ9_9RHOB|nr:DUF2256 domain-containing protein [Phaeovulum veldkampii]MBK5945941.1 DUF2256 domain-containing protein [Phaeovulum veldkampii DSM 11550]PTE18935.1 DUF2256 domain-containing protein [Phaeovulum veldkampii DSM 11550]